jgi:hypothetical protein
MLSAKQGMVFMRTWLTSASILILVICGDRANAASAALSVTWLIPGQPPQTTVTEVSDLAACEKARIKALFAGQEAKAARERMNDENAAEARAMMKKAYDDARAKGTYITGYSPDITQKLKGEPVPVLSAFCIEK